jgi:hypothetical protein
MLIMIVKFAFALDLLDKVRLIECGTSMGCLVWAREGVMGDVGVCLK